MVTQKYPDGIDCVWIASDRDGHVGAFVTGGVGPIPAKALNEDGLLIEELEEEICRLPRVSGSHLLFSVKRPDDFIAIAERGIFVYDWRDVHRTANDSSYVYEPIASPVNPIKVDALPKLLKKLAKNIEFFNLAFIESGNIDVKDQFECFDGES
jgi:hypothetical protein